MSQYDDLISSLRQNSPSTVPGYIYQQLAADALPENYSLAVGTELYGGRGILSGSVSGGIIFQNDGLAYGFGSEALAVGRVHYPQAALIMYLLLKVTQMITRKAQFMIYLTSFFRSKNESMRRAYCKDKLI